MDSYRTPGIEAASRDKIIPFPKRKTEAPRPQPKPETPEEAVAAGVSRLVEAMARFDAEKDRP